MIQPFYNKLKNPNDIEETQGQDELLGAVSWYFAEHNVKPQTDFGPVNDNGVKDQAGNVTNRTTFAGACRRS